jgi:hypothetical protein
MSLASNLPSQPRATKGASPFGGSIPNCTAHSIDWTLFILTLFLLCFSWWVAELPAFFRKSRSSPRWRNFLRAAAWNCTRLTQPSYVAIVAMARTTDARVWPRLYYFGHEKITDGEDVPFRWSQWGRIAATDALTVLTEVGLIVRGAMLSRELKEPLFFAAWLFPSLVPVALGCHLFLIRQFPVRRFLAGLYGFLGLCAIGTAFVLTISFSAKSGTYAAPLSGSLAIAWVTVMFPLPTMHCCGGRFHGLFFLFAGMARILFLWIDMMRSREDFVFCSINYPGVIATYAVLSGAVVVILAIGGGTACEQYRPQLHKLVELERNQVQQDEEDGEGVALTGAEAPDDIHDAAEPAASIETRRPELTVATDASKPQSS